METQKNTFNVIKHSDSLNSLFLSMLLQSLHYYVLRIRTIVHIRLEKGKEHIVDHTTVKIWEICYP